MKTLDEVIEALTICKNPDINRNCKDCPMPDTQECMGVLMTDALHYLKEYKRISARLEKIALGNITETLEKLDNPALTWDELRSMEGKPVWVEYDNHLSGRKRIKYKIWDVIDWVAEDLILVKGEFCYQKDEFGDVWQAYRKERE